MGKQYDDHQSITKDRLQKICLIFVYFGLSSVSKPDIFNKYNAVIGHGGVNLTSLYHIAIILMQNANAITFTQVNILILRASTILRMFVLFENKMHVSKLSPRIDISFVGVCEKVSAEL